MGPFVLTTNLKKRVVLWKSVENVENASRRSIVKMRRSPGNRGHTGNWRDVVSGKWTPYASLRKFGGQVDDSGTTTNRQMLMTLKALVEEFDLERVEVNGWVITFRDTSRIGARHSGKSSGENSNFVSR